VGLQQDATGRCHIAGDAAKLRTQMQRGARRRARNSNGAMTAQTKCGYYPWLQKPPFMYRQIITAHWMQHAQHQRILDLGAYSNPIDGFLQHCPKEVVVVEPCGELAAAHRFVDSEKRMFPTEPWLSEMSACPLRGAIRGASKRLRSILRTALNTSRELTAEELDEHLSQRTGAIPSQGPVQAREFIRTVSPSTARTFFDSRTSHRFDAIVCMGCDGFIGRHQRGVLRSMLLSRKFPRPLHLYLEFQHGFEPSRKEFAASAHDDNASAAAYVQAGCKLVGMVRLPFETKNNLPGPRILQHVYCESNDF